MNRIEMIKQALCDLTSTDVASPKQLQAIMQGMDLSLGGFEPYVEEPDCLPYGRTILYQSEAVEAVLIHLPSGTETLIHDHGSSVGSALLLEGRLMNRFFRLQDDGFPYLAGETDIPQGSYYFAPEKQIHQLRNAGPSRAVAFHIYAPAPEGVKSYSLPE
jgi:cysteine dioxygenase